MQLYFLSEDVSMNDITLQLQQRRWKLESRSVSEEDLPPDLRYCCISYTWGSGRQASPFDPDTQISDRTIPALETFIRHRPQCARIWIDAFCIPPAGKARASSLESMGWIYSKAEQVVAVLSSSSLPVLKYMHGHDHILPEHLHLLEKEAWVSRAWTYQETVNSQELFITCEDANSIIIDGDQFLNCIGHTLHRLPESPLEKRLKYPRLDVFEDVIGDYIMVRLRAAFCTSHNVKHGSQISNQA